MRLKVAGLGDVIVEKDKNTKGINSECGICLQEPIANPVVLKECHHAFCSGCLITWQNYHQRAEMSLSRAGFPCPWCRSENTEDVEQALIDRAMLLGSRGSSKATSQDEKTALWTEALACVDKVLDAKDFLITACANKAEALIELGRGSEAIEVLAEMIEEDKRRKENPVIDLIDLADKAEARGDEDEANRLQLETVEMFELHGMPATRLANYTDAYLLQCRAYESQGEWSKAYTIYHSMLASIEDPESESPVTQRKLFMGMANCFYELGEFEKAIAASEAALTMNCHYPGVHQVKALSEKAMGSLEEAIKTMNCAVLYETPWDDDNKAEVLRFYNELLVERLT